MRAFHRMAKMPPRRKQRRVRLCAVTALFLFLLLGIDHQLRPVITQMAEYQCRLISLRAINEAVEEELSRMGDLDSVLVRTEKNKAGTINAIEVNAIEVTRLKTQLTSAVAQRLLELGKQEISIPLGTLLGWQILSGRGPNIRLQVVPASFVRSFVTDSLESAGINQTQHRVLIKFEVDMSAILPGYAVSVLVEDEVCVAQTLVVGEVPKVYASAS